MSIDDVLAETWTAEDDQILLNVDYTIGDFSNGVVNPVHAERARQAALGHLALKLLAQASNDGVFDAGHAAALDAIVRELRKEA